MKRLLWLIVIILALVWTLLSHSRHRARNRFRDGPTCGSYYHVNDLLLCPDKHEFDSIQQKCVPIGERGCTAASTPSVVTADETTCGPGRAYRRNPNRPCQCLLKCNSDDDDDDDDDEIYSDEGYCFALRDDGRGFEQIECMRVPGCRNLDRVHFEKYIDELDDDDDDDDVRLECPFVDRIVRDGRQPCFRGWICDSDNTLVPVTCPYSWQCIDTHPDYLGYHCVPCHYNDRCRHHDVSIV
ncbi:hypothetical protein [Alphabaculovirus myunipunctae]|uniref:Uncharacterized protein n=1 Tax=Mythimna unipuncta nucleopolyhedrovirus TaxID=447897 RepID=A0A2K9VSE7_9ABAC|nr:hypothetical protein [Mythimna unipuncta nucleopolyhedrovirus]AUV65370.1 hypothetical protein [Mythimna unipuncta nucleopolyhedrovirus]